MKFVMKNALAIKEDIVNFIANATKPYANLHIMDVIAQREIALLIIVLVI
jgi:hypothetical protein